MRTCTRCRRIATGGTDGGSGWGGDSADRERAVNRFARTLLLACLLAHAPDAAVQVVRFAFLRAVLARYGVDTDLLREVLPEL